MGDDYNWGYKTGRKMAHELAGGGRVQVKGYSRGGPVKTVTPVKAVHKHEKALHPGKPLTKFK